MNNATSFEATSHIGNPLEDLNSENEPANRQYDFAEEPDSDQNDNQNRFTEDGATESNGFESMQDQEPAKTSKIKKFALGLIAALVLGGGGYTFYKVQSDAAAAKAVQEQEAKAATAAAQQRATAAEAADKLAKEKKVLADKQAAQDAETAKLEAERLAAENAKKSKIKAEAKANPKVVYPTISAKAVERSYQPKQPAPKQAWFTVNPN